MKLGSKTWTDRPSKRLLLLLACLYLPYAWLVWIDDPWGAYRWFWVRMWPILPGLLVHAIPEVHRAPDAVGFLIMAVIAAVFFGMAVVLARRGWRSTLAGSLAIGAFSCLNSIFAYALFRA